MLLVAVLSTPRPRRPGGLAIAPGAAPGVRRRTSASSRCAASGLGGLQNGLTRAGLESPPLPRERCESQTSDRGDLTPSPSDGSVLNGRTRSRHGRQLPAGEADVLRRVREGRRVRGSSTTSARWHHRPPDGDPHEPRHAVLGRRVRPRRRTGHRHAARLRQAVHVDAGDRRGPVRAERVLRAGQVHDRKGRRRHPVRRPGHPYVRRPQESRGPRCGARAADAIRRTGDGQV